MRLNFTKMQGVGNDFVVVDGRDAPERDWSAVALRVCSRRYGVGADGLLVLDTSERADFQMRMYNPDGTPDVCGNGLRCMARYAFDRGVHPAPEMQIETRVDVRPARILRDVEGRFQAVQVGMGKPQFAPQDIPMRVSGRNRVLDYPVPLPNGDHLCLTALSTGSTHSVVFTEELPDDDRFFAVSPLLENHPLFPERTSLLWCKVESEQRLRLRIWERGVGETWGCGTGACAAAVAAVLRGEASAETPIAVVSRGGALQIEWLSDATLRMTGPADYVFEGVTEA